MRAVTVAAQQGASLRLVARPDSPAARIVARVAMVDVLALSPSIEDVVSHPYPCPLEAELDS